MNYMVVSPVAVLLESRRRETPAGNTVSSQRYIPQHLVISGKHPAQSAWIAATCGAPGRAPFSPARGATTRARKSAGRSAPRARSSPITPKDILHVPATTRSRPVRPRQRPPALRDPGAPDEEQKGDHGRFLALGPIHTRLVCRTRQESDERSRAGVPARRQAPAELFGAVLGGSEQQPAPVPGRAAADRPRTECPPHARPAVGAGHRAQPPPGSGAYPRPQRDETTPGRWHPAAWQSRS